MTGILLVLALASAVWFLGVNLDRLWIRLEGKSTAAALATQPLRYEPLVIAVAAVFLAVMSL